MVYQVGEVLGTGDLGEMARAFYREGEKAYGRDASVPDPLPDEMKMLKHPTRQEIQVSANLGSFPT